ncbi:uncharacterized protein LOC143265893 [Megachile rotundata]|uniref:uncharacterized protein LOC143265893 n=1 Tax=Megachile rotundata TaxID=143995 RepID=UPI003FD589D7
MERIVNKNYMYNIELQSLHYWFKNAPSQNSSNKYSNVLKIMQNTIYKNDVSDVIRNNIQDYTNISRRSQFNFYNREILRNVFEHWKMYVIHKLHARRAMFKASYFYNKKLRKMILNTLSKNVLLKWQHIVFPTNKYSNEVVSPTNYIKLETYYNNALLKRYFIFWVNYTSIRNKKKLLLEKAVTFYNSRCLKKCIFIWKIYVMQQRQKKTMQNKVLKFYAKGILQKYMTAWISICEFTLLKNKIENVVTFYNNKLVLKYFYTWKKYYKVKLQKLYVEKYVQTYYRKKLLGQYLKQFIMYVNESITDKMAQERATIFYNSKLMKKAFAAWQYWYNKKVDNATKIYQIRSIFEDKQKLQILTNWRLYIFNKKCKRRKMFMSQNFYNKNLTIKVVRKLHSYTVYKKEKRIKLFYVNDKSRHIIQKLQYLYIDKWKKALYGAVQEKQKLNQAINFWELIVTRKYLFYWKEFSQQYKMKTLRKQNLYAIAADFLVKRFMLHWYSKLKDALVVHKKETLVIAMIEHKIMGKCLLSWKEYVAKKIKMKNCIEEAKEIHKEFLLREGLKKILRNSLHNIDDQYDMQLENAIIRSYTNFEILKEYFNKWYSLIYPKNKSKFLYKIIENNSSQLIELPISTDLENTSLILPDYMKKSVRIMYTK